MALDSDSSPSSPDMPDSRKRPLDGEQDNTERKRSHFGADGSVYLKILVPCTAAGAIIGKGGETIAQVQKEVNARVKMSKANDFYPGTTERVCLIKGTIDAILAMLSFIMDKIKEKPDPNTKAMDFDNKLTVDRDKQVKILVPNSTAGMIIGKGGSFIKQIKEESGAYIQISQKAKDQTLQERCITVIGDGESNKKACFLILTKIGEDPQSGTCLNISYADVVGPVANFNPTGSPYAQGTSAGGSNSGGVPGSQTGAPMQNGSSYSGAHLNNALGTSSSLNSSLGSLGVSLSLGLGYNPPTPVLLGQVLEHVKGVLRSTGFTDLQATEACNALHTLATYGMLGMGGPAATPGPMTGSIAPSNGLWMNGYGSGYGSSIETNGHSAQVGGAFGPIGSTPQRYADTATVASAATSSYDPFRRGNSPTLPVNQNSFGLGTQPPPPPPPPISSVTTAQTSADGSKVDLHIGENIVGAILGHGGKALLEIQHFSGANIQISKKGVYAPGTRNRIVSITGTPNAISTAQYLIEQRISEEEAKRARQSALSGVSVGVAVAKLDTGVVPSLH